MHVLDVEIDSGQRLVLTVESGQLRQGGPACGVFAVGHGHRVRLLHDAPVFRPGQRCPLVGANLALTRTKLFDRHVQRAHDLAPPRMALTVRAVR